MMAKLLAKELRLALHPTNIIFLTFPTAADSQLSLSDNFFYTSLGIFFLCQNGRRIKDIYYSLLLPVRQAGYRQGTFWPNYYD